MNRIRLLLIVTGVVFILTSVIFLGNPVTIGAAEKCSIVTIRGRDNIEPNMLTIRKGDCVVWINFTGSATQSEGIVVSFKEGEKCVSMTKAPVGFKMDVPKGCYVAGSLSYGETASLMFPNPGTYNYDVEFKVGGKTSATIIVK
jgi:hypothetical protein